jgi:stage II sporulation protein R
MNDKLKKLELSILCALTVTVILSLFGVSTVAFDKKLNSIRDKVFRLHILANSDSAEDQSLKLKVRDAVLKETEEKFNPQNKNEAINYCKENLDLIKKTAETEIKKNGYNYPINAYIDKRYFNIREYEDVTMPSGFYDSLVIEIGKAEGKNWWCVMFPPLCIPPCTDDNQSADLDYNEKSLNKVMDDEESEMLINNKYKFKFKSVEIFNDIKNKIGEIF